MKKMLLIAALAVSSLTLAGVSLAVAEEPAIEIQSDVIASVGDQQITFGEINTLLNSSAVVGLSVPSLGTPERDTARVLLLDKFISANLLYLDAVKQGADQDPVYRRELARFSDAILAGRYWDQLTAGEVAVTEEQIQAVFREKAEPDEQLTDDVRLRITSTLRKAQRKARMAAAQQNLREGIEVKVHEENLALEGDAERADDTPLAEVGDEILAWGQIKDRIIQAGKGAVLADPEAGESEARRAALEREIDLRILVGKARAAGLESDPLYQRRVAEYTKNRLINRHRDQLLQGMEPDDETLKTYYEENRARFVLPETRDLQMVVVKTEGEASELKVKIEAGELTMYEAARNHSIAANAGEDLGEVGWVNQGELVPALDEVVFSLGPGEIGGPVETPAGWHLVLVKDVKQAEFTDFGNEATRKLVRRRYLDEKLNVYTVDLRTKEFEVKVYEDRLLQLAQREADMVGELTEKGQEPGSVTKERIKELQKYMQPGK
jgi:parvulin-like peptidyl-prolyl isomerase